MFHSIYSDEYCFDKYNYLFESLNYEWSFLDLDLYIYVYESIYIVIYISQYI